MKKRNYFYLSLLAAAVSFTACSSEESVAGSDGNQSEEAQSYVAVKIVAPQTTRATYENGTADESKISSLDFYFYDENGNFVAKGLSSTNVNLNEQTKGQNVSHISDAVVALGPAETSRIKKVMAVVNSPANLTNMSLTEARKSLTDIQYNGAYSMSGAAWDGNADGTSAVTEANIKPSSAEAIATGTPVQIYIERLAAKVKATVDAAITGSKANVTNGQGQNAQDATVTILGWGLTATEPQEYLIKNIQDNAAYYTGWSSAADHRSFWAEDAHYGAGITYPASDDEYKADGPLNYIPFSKIVASGITGTTSAEMYTTENTANVNPKANQAYTSLLVAAQLQLGKDQTASATAEDLFRFRGVLYNLDNYKNAFLNSLGVVLYKKTGDAKYEKMTAADLDIDAGANGEAYNGLITLKTVDANEKWYTYEEGTKTYTEYTGLSTAIGNIEQAEGFKNGYMYYSIPIVHNADVTKQPGNLGVVRNHVYSININKISGIGHSVWNPETVIVPNDKQNEGKNYIGATINVLSWNIVPAQDAELK